jgi:hypothetical protein
MLYLLFNPKLFFKEYVRKIPIFVGAMARALLVATMLSEAIPNEDMQ